jgi:hypothetical protein
VRGHPAAKRAWDKAIGALGIRFTPSSDRLAIAVAKLIGSWNFLLWETVFIAGWMILNLIGWARSWDPYPFILMNLVLSLEAAYTAPLLLMAQNRDAERDRLTPDAEGSRAMSPRAGALYGAAWLRLWLDRASGLSFDDAQAAEVGALAERKLVDLFDVAEETALANGRARILRHDLPAPHQGPALVTQPNGVARARPRARAVARVPVTRGYPVHSTSWCGRRSHG